MRLFVRLSLFLLAAVIAIALYASWRTPGHLYRESGVFAGCPPRPSCVSSVASDPRQRVEPLHYRGDPASARERLLAAINAMTGSRIQQVGPNYLHVLFVTPRMRFRDDLELLIDAGGEIQVRSISRFGYRDFGVNRARIEDLRRRFAALDD
ncbi:DUF1499 domain-containing protein [Sinimarinibacterium thermocellulolyticum]|uniref:DUF1499 domain-containing protein n=1 Tax=Sinimarinibacterium thermocellulolyticum TaxID=3170016 RepID=A0ABV2ACY0_9GAMM